jgi:hypothetical protein
MPFFLPYFTIIANNRTHEFKHPVLIAEFDIRPPEEGLGKKTDVEHCRHCQWSQTLCMLPR